MTEHAPTMVKDAPLDAITGSDSPFAELGLKTISDQLVKVEDLPLARREAAQTIANKIDLLDTAGMTSLGERRKSRLQSITEQMLEEGRVKDLGDIEPMVAEALRITQSVDLESFTGIMYRLTQGTPLEGLFDKANDIRNGFKKASSAINDMDRVFCQRRAAAVESIVRINQMVEEAVDAYREMEDLIAGLVLAVSDIDARIKAAKEEGSTDLVKIQELSDLIDARDLGIRKIFDFEGVKMATITSVPRFRVLQKLRASQADKFNTFHEVLVPLWAREVSFAIQVMELGKDNSLLDGFSTATKNLLETSSESFKSAAIEAQRQVNRPAVLAETITKIVNDTIETVTQIQAIQTEAEKAGWAAIEQQKADVKRLGVALQQLRSDRMAAA